MEKKCRMMIGGVFFLANVLLIGCDADQDQNIQPQPSHSSSRDTENAMAQKNAGVLTELQETTPGQYRIIQEYPSTATGAVINRLDGSREVLPDEKVRELVNNAGDRSGYGVGAVLASGLVGYMMGKTVILNPDVYRGGDLYARSLANKDLMDQRRREEERRSSVGSGFRTYTGWGYSGGRRTEVGSGLQAPPAGKQGFFSRMTSSLRSFAG
jgi:hypothetical protein